MSPPSQSIPERPNFITFRPGPVSSHPGLADVHYITCQTRPTVAPSEPDRIGSHFSAAEFRHMNTQPNFVTFLPARISSHFKAAEFHHITSRLNFVTFQPGHILSHSKKQMHFITFRTQPFSTTSEPDQISTRRAAAEFRHITTWHTFIAFPPG